MGEFIGPVLLISIGGILRFTIGSKTSYNKIAEKYKQLPDEIQARTIKKSLLIFLVSFVILLILIFIP